jgi:hypothetical protein
MLMAELGDGVHRLQAATIILSSGGNVSELTPCCNYRSVSLDVASCGSASLNAEGLPQLFSGLT